MTSRRNILIVGLVVLGLVLYLANIVHEELEMREDLAAIPENTSPPIESVNTEELFEAEDPRATEDDTVAQEQEDGMEEQGEDGDEQVACTMEAKQCPDGSFVGRTGPNCEFAQCPEVEEEAATSTPLPTMTINSEGVAREGTVGSYCWEDLCQTSIITDLPYDPIPVSASGTLAFTIDATVSPERISYFLKEVDGTEIVFQRDLTQSEVQSGAFQLEPMPGEYLLFITGIWPGGEDVANAFKIEII